MSQSAAARPAVRAPRPGPGPRAVPSRPSPPRLRVVSAPRSTRSRAGLVAVCAGLLVLGLVGLLLLNVSLERGTYDLRDQSTRADQLREQRQRLQVELRARAAPADLDRRARGLGMVDAPPSPLFLVGGRTLGVPMRAPAPQRPSVTTKPSPSVTVKTPKATNRARTPGASTATSGTATPATDR